MTTESAGTGPTIVPVHGAWADASSFAAEIRALVGHSYGGAVVSSAAVGNDQVKALVYLSGWMPDEGESIAQLFEERGGGGLAATAIRPQPFTARDGSEAGQDL